MNFGTKISSPLNRLWFLRKRPIVNIFNEIIVSEASAEDQLFFIENLTPEVFSTVIKTLKQFSIHSQNNNLR